MAPPDMLLRIGQVAGYNNEIVVATDGQKLGVNAGANVATPTPVVPAATGEKCIVAKSEPNAGKPAGVERSPSAGGCGCQTNTER